MLIIFHTDTDHVYLYRYDVQYSPNSGRILALLQTESRAEVLEFLTSRVHRDEPDQEVLQKYFSDIDPFSLSRDMQAFTLADHLYINE